MSRRMLLASQSSRTSLMFAQVVYPLIEASIIAEQHQSLYLVRDNKDIVAMVMYGVNRACACVFALARSYGVLYLDTP